MKQQSINKNKTKYSKHTQTKQISNRASSPATAPKIVAFLKGHKLMCKQPIKNTRKCTNLSKYRLCKYGVDPTKNLSAPYKF